MKKSVILNVFLIAVFFCFSICSSALAAQRTVQLTIPGCSA